MLPQFPRFLPLTLELKGPYDQALSGLPPYSDASFATMHIWWGISEKIQVSSLHDNLIIEYDLFNDAAAAGMSVVGNRQMDETLRTLFDHLAQQQRPVKLVHVPEFAVEAIKDRSKLEIIEEPDFREYILDSQALAGLEGGSYKTLRKKVKRFQKSVEDRQLELQELDLAIEGVHDQLFASILEWEQYNQTANDRNHDEHLALKRTLRHAKDLDMKALALYVDKKLEGFVTYHQPGAHSYYILHHLKANYQHPYITDYLYHEVAKRAAKHNVSSLNIEMDLGIENLKQHKLTLRPARYFHKYTVQPIR